MPICTSHYRNNNKDNKTATHSSCILVLNNLWYICCWKTNVRCLLFRGEITISTLMDAKFQLCTWWKIMSNTKLYFIDYTKIMTKLCVSMLTLECLSDTVECMSDTVECLTHTVFPLKRNMKLSWEIFHIDPSSRSTVQHLQMLSSMNFVTRSYKPFGVRKLGLGKETNWRWVCSKNRL